MAILYGTQSNGETLPVLVDQFGNLLAKGIEGQPGTPGEPGAPGPPGAPGVGELPPDPYEGAILGWEDGQLAWIGGSVSLPAGTYGPYTYIENEGRLDIPQDASSLVNGQTLYMSDLNGKEISAEYSTDTIAKVSGGANPVLTFPTDNNFDKFEVGDVVGAVVYGDGSDYPVIYTEDRMTATSNDLVVPKSPNNFVLFNNSAGIAIPASPAYEVGIRASLGGSFTAVVDFDGYASESRSVTTTTSAHTNHVFYRNTSGQAKKITKITITSLTNGMGLDNVFILPQSQDPYALLDESIKVVSIDDTVPSITVDGGKWLGSDNSGDPAGATDISKVLTGSGSVLLGSDGAIVMRSNNGEWVDGFYVTAPEQLIAARKLVPDVLRNMKM